MIELQHGVIHPFHYGYSYPNDREKRHFPDYLFLFGPFWREMADFPIGEERLIDCGYPYLESKVEEYKNTDTKDQILFISQQSIGEPLSRVAQEVSRHTDSRVIYKLHPREYEGWQSRYPWLVGSDINVVSSDDPPLYRLFAESRTQIGVGSTALYEGLMFGLETFLLNLPSIQYTRPLAESGYATVVESTEDLASKISLSQSVTIKREDLFTESSIKTIKKELERLVAMPPNEALRNGRRNS
ncbi:hypothetical protein [Halosimplex halophilum]|uniref:hypothetical protein n=1 Tax=Halosimplex halophilum TaxID=2559572 RepID=UPI00107F9089|nr:hypothetical protein [Halosimplex halophilum]